MKKIGEKRTKTVEISDGKDRKLKGVKYINSRWRKCKLKTIEEWRKETRDTHEKVK